jgi:hypothetical protein
MIDNLPAKTGNAIEQWLKIACDNACTGDST